jgi:hypothetical protein
MPLSVEDGTGKADASTYQDAAAVLAYLTLRGLGTVFSALTSTEQDTCAVLATDYLDNQRRYRYRGARLVATQALAWPRTNVVDDDGFPITGVPSLLLRAHAEVCGVLAVRKATRGLTPQALQPVLARGGKILSQSGAGFSQTFAADAPSEDRLVMVDGLLRTLLTSSDDGLLPTFTSATDDLTAFDVEA